MSRIVIVSEGKLQTRDGTDVVVPVANLDPTVVTSAEVLAIKVLTKTAYTALTPKVATTLYIASDTGGVSLGSTTIVAGS